MIGRVPLPRCRSSVIGLAIAGNPENGDPENDWRLPAPARGGRA
jgi:hypothetical protein